MDSDNPGHKNRVIATAIKRLDSDRVDASDLPTIKALRARHDLLINSLAKESSRGLILIGAAFMNDVLEELISYSFSIESPKLSYIVRPLFEGFGPLTSLSARIRIGYALDLIPKWMHDDLEIIRKLRNYAAHSVGEFDFGAPDVARLTERLVGANHAVLSRQKRENKTTRSKPSSGRNRIGRAKDNRATTERLRFLMTLGYIVRDLLDKVIISSMVDVPATQRRKLIKALYDTP